MTARLFGPAVVAGLVLAAAAGEAPAQQGRGPVRLRSFGAGGQPAAGGALFQSQMGSWARQLDLAVGGVRAAVAGLPPGQRAAAERAAEDAARQAVAFARVARQTGDPGQLARAQAVLDQTLARLTAAAQQAAPGDRRVAAALARVRYTDDRLHGALAEADPNVGNRADAVARVARGLEDQADQLQVLVDATGGPGADRNLVRALRQFGRRAGQVAAGFEAGGGAAQAQQAYAGLAAEWQAVQPGLTAAAADQQVQAQAAQVDGLFRELGQLLAVAPAVAPGGGLPAPGFGVVSAKARVLVVGAGEGGGPRVRVFHDIKGDLSTDFFAYDPDYRGGVRVAVADLNGDGFPEVVTAPGRDHPPVVRVFDGRDLNLLAEFEAYQPPFDLGVYVAAADLTPDGRALIATGPGPGGGPHVRVFDLAQGREIDTFMAGGPNERGGARVALGDVTGDGYPDLAVGPGPGAPPVVRVFNGRDRAVVAEIEAFDRRFLGGVFVTVADLRPNRAGRAEVVVGADVGGPPVVRAFDVVRGRLVGELQAYPAGFRGGVRVAAYDVTDDGVLDVVCAPGPGPGRQAPMRMFDGRSRAPVGELLAFEPQFTGGVFVASR